MADTARFAQLASPVGKPARGPRDIAVRAARTCYDHLAGGFGVALTDALLAGNYIEWNDDAGIVTDAGLAMFERLGVDVLSLRAGNGRKRRVLCRPCLDWTERRPHLAGALGAALCTRAFEENWIRRIESSRAVVVTPKGWRVLGNTLGVNCGATQPGADHARSATEAVA